MASYVFQPQPHPHLPIVGSDAVFPVHRIYCVGRNFADHAVEMGHDPNKEIEEAVRHAESHGWSVRMSNGHAWGKLYCPRNSRDGCLISVWSTPRNAENHARGILRAVARCDECHGGGCDEKI